MALPLILLAVYGGVIAVSSLGGACIGIRDKYFPRAGHTEHSFSIQPPNGRVLFSSKDPIVCCAAIGAVAGIAIPIVLPVAAASYGASKITGRPLILYRSTTTSVPLFTDSHTQQAQGTPVQEQ